YPCRCPNDLFTIPARHSCKCTIVIDAASVFYLYNGDWIRIGKFSDLLKCAINFIINLSRIQVNKLAGNRGNEALEF
ncbi:MAG: hypothetical protein KAI93_12420, partial [Desulfobacterales bacterium]|nr:hypothetical protein [Desulfobacterales bacterium]